MDNPEKAVEYPLTPAQQCTVLALAQEMDRLNKAMDTVKEALEDLGRRYAADVEAQGSIQFVKTDAGEIRLQVMSAGETEEAL